jgi:hypothetical protein
MVGDMLNEDGIAVANVYEMDTQLTNRVNGSGGENLIT